MTAFTEALKERTRERVPRALDDPGSVLAVKGTLRRFAPWTAASRSGGRRYLRGKEGGWSWLSGCFGPCGRAERNLSDIPDALGRSRGALSPAGP